MLGIEFSQNQKRAIAVCVAISAIALSVVLVRKSGRNGDVVIREPGSTSYSSVVATDSDSMNGIPESGEVVVHVVGAVKRPGVYKLDAGKRVTDAIEAAGGATADANPNSLNLAAKLRDGSQIVVPCASTGPSGTPSSYTAGAYQQESPSSGDKLRNPGDGTVSINTAGSEELQRLPGVGPATAHKIIEYRQQLGRFARVEQLMDVSGIGPKKFEQMKPFVTL